MKNKTSIFSSLLVLALTMLVSVSAQAQAYNPIEITGPVTAFKPADCGQPGSVTISGVQFTIAAGIDLNFAVGGIAVRNGSIVDATYRAHPAEVPGSNRRIRAYLDPAGRIRTWISTAAVTSRTLNITGVVNAIDAGSITINNKTFKIASGTTVAATADATKVVRITGSFNTSNELSGTVNVSNNPYDRVSFCGGPRGYATEGPITFVPTIGVYNADGAGFLFGGDLVCDQGIGAMTFGAGGFGSGLGGTLPFAPNFSIPTNDVSVNESACYDLWFDQFSWLTTGSQKTAEESADRICGTVVSFTPAPDFTTPPGEGAQRGSVRLGGANGGISLTISAKQKLTNQELLTSGAKVCIFPVYSPSDFTGGILPGTTAPVRPFHLMSGTRVVLQP